MQESTIPPNDKPISSIRTQPGELYKETFDQILSGFVTALNMNNGNIDLVSLSTIEAVSDVDPNMLEMYYKNTRAILNEVISYLQGLIIQAAAYAGNHDAKDAIRHFLELLSGQPMMLRTLQASKRNSFWVQNLKGFVRKVAASWPEEDKVLWDDLYCVLCFQFQQLLDHWAATGYTPGQIAMLTRHFCAWINADGVFAHSFQNPTEVN